MNITEHFTTGTAYDSKLSCSANPMPVNGHPNPRGCDGARYGGNKDTGLKGGISRSYCEGLKGKMPWYEKCCDFKGGKCINKGSCNIFNKELEDIQSKQNKDTLHPQHCAECNDTNTMCKKCENQFSMKINDNGNCIPIKHLPGGATCFWTNDCSDEIENKVCVEDFSAKKTRCGSQKFTKLKNEMVKLDNELKNMHSKMRYALNRSLRGDSASDMWTYVPIFWSKQDNYVSDTQAILDRIISKEKELNDYINTEYNIIKNINGVMEEELKYRLFNKLGIGIEDRIWWSGCEKGGELSPHVPCHKNIKPSRSKFGSPETNFLLVSRKIS